jgi:hypothetical protein
MQLNEICAVNQSNQSTEGNRINQVSAQGCKLPAQYQWLLIELSYREIVIERGANSN